MARCGSPAATLVAIAVDVGVRKSGSTAPKAAIDVLEGCQRLENTLRIVAI